MNILDVFFFVFLFIDDVGRACHGGVGPYPSPVNNQISHDATTGLSPERSALVRVEIDEHVALPLDVYTPPANNSRANSAGFGAGHEREGRVLLAINQTG